MAPFKLHAPYVPRGDQPQAIEKLVRGLETGVPFQTLLGVTGSGKTFTLANVIQRVQKPTLVISHNKTLAAQLYGEFKEFFPENAVHYFVSYYDYYQPEAYIPQKDLYIEKDASINQDLDRLRLAATSALMERRDTIVVASVSCIYSLGDPESYRQMVLPLAVGSPCVREDLLRRLVTLQYERGEIDFKRATFRAKGGVVEIFPSYEEFAWRVTVEDDRIAALQAVHPVSGDVLHAAQGVTLYPAKHFIMPKEKLAAAVGKILAEMEERVTFFRDQGKLLEAQRIEARTRYDCELMTELGYCPGIENYSRPLAGREPDARPATLFDYFPEDALVVVDEAHVTVPQIRGMFNGDRARKQTLVEHGFRLPSALDNRPLRFPEWEAIVKRAIFVSATPGPYERERCGPHVVEQLIRPTGLLDPEVEVRPTAGQIEDLLARVKERVKAGERTLVTTLTKRLAEELSDYMREKGVKVSYLHSELDAFERVDVLTDLRKGKIDCAVGVNLLREGLDLPEVSLVAILDADKEGFLRSETSLVQTIGRAARNVNARVVLYADRVTPSMDLAIRETARRRAAQTEYNRKNGITPQTIRKEIRKTIEIEREQAEYARTMVRESPTGYATGELVFELEGKMMEAARLLQFEHAAEIRDRILKLKPDWKGDFIPSVEGRRRGPKGKRRSPRAAL